MAEYKALAQNTYKFVTETVLQNNGQIDVPTVANLPRLKMIESDSKIYYHTFSPIGRAYAGTWYLSASEGLLDATSTYNWSNSNYVKGYHLLGQYLAPYNFPGDLPEKINIDGTIYYGARNAYYGTCWFHTVDNGTVSGLSKKYFPKGTIKFVRYDVASNTIVGGSFDFNDKVLASVLEHEKEGYASISYQKVYLKIPKANVDIILGISVEYPKYDITLNGTGLQYSLDDGFTFNDVTDGLALEQIEHLVLKNTGETDITIGTTSGGSEVGTVAAGTTYVAVPTESGTWYIG